MTRIGQWTVLPLFVLVAALPAAPPLSEPPGPSQPLDSQLQLAAQNYADTLVHLVSLIEEQYGRPVSAVELYEAALAGLFEAARQPIPDWVSGELQRLSASDPRALTRKSHALIRRAREELGNHDALLGSRALVASMKALPRALDPHSGLTGPREFQSLEDGAPQTGLEFPIAPPLPDFSNAAPDGIPHAPDGAPNKFGSKMPGPVRILGVQPGSPAQKSGIRPGDRIVSIDGLRPEDPRFEIAFQRLPPNRGSLQPGITLQAAPIKLSLKREGRAEPIEISLMPAKYRTETIFGARRQSDGTWDYMLDANDRIGYIRVGNIQTRSHVEFADALKSIIARNLAGLVLDLRWCPGGYLDETSTIARCLLAPDRFPIARQRDRSGKVSPVDEIQINVAATDFPVVVLVGNETSGGGELIAAVLQDFNRAVIAGQRTVGKFTVQKTLQDAQSRLRIPFKITTGVLIRPRNKDPQSTELQADDWPVRPDPGCELPASAELNQQLKTWHTLHTIRPAGCIEALPLDDPDNDPQRQAAVQMLKKGINRGMH